MSLTLDSFWKLLETSKLLSPNLLQQLAQQTAQLAVREPASLAKKLVEQKLITAYQAEILLAGHNGPFHFGNYTIGGKYNEGPLAGQFKGRHTPTQHPVLMTFFPGTSAGDLVLWQNVEQQVHQLSSVKSPFVTGVYETVVMPNYRFVVSQRPDGVRFQERLPPKARLPWKDACTLMAQVAHGIESLHRHGLTCQPLSADSIWINKAGFTQVRPELPTHPGLAQTLKPSFEKQPSTQTSDSPISAFSQDWTSFGEIMFRMISGKRMGLVADAVDQDANCPRSPEAVQQELSKHELPAELIQCLTKLLYPSLESSGTSDISQLLSGMATKPLKAMLPPELPTLAAYQTAITRFVPGGKKSARELPKLDTGAAPLALVEQAPILVAPSKAEGAANRLSPSLTRSSAVASKRKWIPLAITMGAIWAFCGLLGLGAYYASRSTAPGPTIAKTTAPPISNSLPSDEPGKEPAGGTNSSPNPAASLNQPPALRPVLEQTVVEDDRSLLWQSPTTGPAIDLSGLPSAPKIIIAIRPAELIENPDGVLLLKSFGAEFSRVVAAWEAMSGIALTEVDQLVVSLHTNAEFRYEAYVRCQLIKPIASSELIRRWQTPQPRSTENQNLFYARGDQTHGFVVLNSPGLDRKQRPSQEVSEAQENEVADSIQRFGMGNLQLVAEVADAPQSGASSILQSLAERTDQLRQINLLFLRPALFNDEGQALMQEKWAPLNRELAELLPDEVQGGSLSLHLDQGTYFELQFAQTVDLKGLELQQRLEARFRDLRDRTTQRIALIPASAYWDPVRLKLNLMTVDAFRSLRWGVEHGEVVANAWLPPMAAHNLVAATELAMTFSSGTSTSSSSTSVSAAGAGDTPQTLEELLQRKRILKVANPPDLNLLMSDLEAEIKEEFPGLPFQFRLRLMGPDLQLEGITQNQRPSELNLEQLSLSEILTKIMVSANPAKDISGANDPRCKLVWAIADDPDHAGQKIILITTRSAAQQKNYQLPPAFQTE